MKINFLIVALAAIFLMGCEPPQTKVRIADPVAREKYLEVLTKTKNRYEVQADASIIIYTNMDDLENDMREFMEWEKTRLKAQGVVFPNDLQDKKQNP